MKVSTTAFLLAVLSVFAACSAPVAGARNTPQAPAIGTDSTRPATWTRSVPPVPLPPPGTPLVAIVIDDCGESLEQVVPFLGIPVPISFSILPYHPGVAETVRTLHRHGRETLVHVPMEPNNPKWLENDWFLRPDMTGDEIEVRLGRALDAVPTASGINNHMGSKFCADEHAMTTVMRLVKEEGMYYLDSRTSPGSTASGAAAAVGTPFLTRDVFLDNNDDVALITIQLEELVETAKRNGCAVGIGHARTRTAEAIMNFVRDRDRGVVFVPAGRLFGRCRAVPDVPFDQTRIPPE